MRLPASVDFESFAPQSENWEFQPLEVAKVPMDGGTECPATVEVHLPFADGLALEIVMRIPEPESALPTSTLCFSEDYEAYLEFMGEEDEEDEE